MPYPSSSTMATILAGVRKQFEKNSAYQDRNVSTALLLGFANKGLDQIYLNAYPEPDPESFTTVADDWDYIIDGSTAPAIPVSIGEIQRVDYDGDPIPRRLFVEQVVTPTSSDASGTPDFWWVNWKDGVRYINFKPAPDDAVTVTLWASRMAAALTATSDTLRFDQDFWWVLEEYIIYRVYLYLGQTKEGRDWRDEFVLPGIRTIKAHVTRRLGRNPHQRKTHGPRDVLKM